MFYSLRKAEKLVAALVCLRHQTSDDGTRTEQIFTPSVNFTANKSRYF